MRRSLWIASVSVVLVALVAAAWIRLPYYAVGPGPAREVTPLIVIGDRPRFDATGHLVMTTVRWYQVTPLQALVAWIEPDWKVLPERDLYPPNTSVETERQRSISEMDQSKIDATLVVLQELTRYPKDHGTGALVESTVSTCPADGHLFPGDIITRIDGRPIANRIQASRAIESAAPGERLDFVVNVDGQTEHASFTREPCGSNGERLVGVDLLNAFPFDVAISSAEIGGPSAGLMFALGLYELLTPNDLTRGRTIAGTGTIDLGGRVGPIGGIEDKVIAAREAGASIFLAPARNMPELNGIDTGDMRVISVRSFDQAVRALEEGSAGT
jgi:PDZ domain-containing protein